MHGGTVAIDRTAEASAGVEALRDVTTRLLDVDPAGLDDETLHALAVGVQAERSRLAIAAAEVLGEWDARRLWESDGSRSPAHRLSRETRTAVGSARTEITRARRLRHLPVARAAVVEGRLSIDHVDLLGRANTAERRTLFERDEATLVEQCASVRFGDAVRVVRYWANRADDELATNRPGTEPPPQPQSRLHFSTTIDDTGVLDGVFVPIDRAIIDNELTRLTEQIRLADVAAGIDRTPAQRRAAALVRDGPTIRVDTARCTTTEAAVHRHDRRSGVRTALRTRRRHRPQT